MGERNTLYVWTYKGILTGGIIYYVTNGFADIGRLVLLYNKETVGKRAING